MSHRDVVAQRVRYNAPMRDEQLDLFSGPHVASFRFERALEALDLDAAAADAPADQRDAVTDLAQALRGRSPGRADLERLTAARREHWPALLERTWQRMVGRALDGRGIPGVLEGEPAAAFLLRGGERERAERSVQRHLAHHPADPAAWAVVSAFQPLWGALRCAFHGGPLLEPIEDLAYEIESDELGPVQSWLPAYGWLLRKLALAQVEETLTAEGRLDQGPLPIAGDGKAFSVFLVWAERARLAGRGPTPRAIEARRRMRATSEVAFRRYLVRIS